MLLVGEVILGWVVLFASVQSSCRQQYNPKVNDLLDFTVSNFSLYLLIVPHPLKITSLK